jgi:myo-inositol 2-dehydrogenase / D-chiro-inositol 1-dehydrogenase
VWAPLPKVTAIGQSRCLLLREHFVTCVTGLEEPLETGEDGRATLEIIFAAYESAGTERKVALPFVPPERRKPIELWVR